MRRIVTLKFDWVAWRRRLGWTQKQSAAMLGIATTTYCDYEYQNAGHAAPKSVIYLALYVEAHGPIARQQLETDAQARRSRSAMLAARSLQQAPTIAG